MIQKTHSGDFNQGEVAARYGIYVTNVGTASSSGAVTVTDMLPAGLTAIYISGGSGWACDLPTLTCTRSDALATFTSYDEIGLFVTVASNAPANVTNSASVSGGGDINSINNTASNPTIVNPGSSTGRRASSPLQHPPHGSTSHGIL